MELRGGKMAKGQLSKVISSYQQDGVIRREGKTDIIVHNPGRLLDRLQQEWRQPEGKARTIIVSPGLALEGAHHEGQ